MAISFLLISLPNSSALDFKLNSPENVNINESFSITIEAQTSDIYDVKIFVENSDEKIISEIYNDGWKNPRYYLKSAFPQQSKFEIRILSAENYPICARLRKPEKTNFVEQCNNITVISTTKNEFKNKNSEIEERGDDSDDKNDIETDDNEIEDVGDIEDETEEVINNSYRELAIEELKIQNEEKIMLNPEKLEKTEESVFITKYEKQKLLVLYGFSVFCIVIIILLALKKL